MQDSQDVRRVVMGEMAYNALRAEALVRNKNIKTTLEEMVFSNLSPESQKIFNIMRDGKAQIQDDINDNPPHTTPKSIAAASIEKKPEKKKKGTFSDEERDQIKSLQRQGLSAGKIAAKLNRHKSAVSYAIVAMKKRGELADQTTK